MRGKSEFKIFPLEIIFVEGLEGINICLGRYVLKKIVDVLLVLIPFTSELQISRIILENRIHLNDKTTSKTVLAKSD